MRTLLDMVQTILDDANGDEVNSISDTTEAMQCARNIRSVYEDMLTEYDIQAVKRLFQLDGFSDTARPTHMTIPEKYHSVEWIKYDARLAVSDPQDFKDVCYVYPKEFIDLVNRRSSDESNVEIVTDPSGVKLNVTNDATPKWYTMFDDRTVVFDSYNSTVESSLHKAKTQAYGQMTSTLVLDDHSEIILPQELMGLLENEAKALFLDLHGDGAPGTVQRRASRSRVRMQRLRHTMRNNREQFKHTGPDYGRRPR